MRNRRGYAAAVISLTAVAFIVIVPRPRQALRVSKPEVGRHEIVEWSPPLPARVYRNGRLVSTIGGLTEVPGRWPVPWNAPAGDYEVVSSTPVLRSSFKIVPRKPLPLPEGFSALTWESEVSLRTVKVRAPDGAVKDWRGLLDWVEYVGADAFWMMGGRTPGLKPGQVWQDTNFDVFPQIAAECRRRGIKFGLYVMFSLTMSNEKVGGYEYGVDVKDGKVYTTRAVSIRDERRIADTIALLKRFKAIPGVDWVGLDYIRNALGGIELAEDFYREMPGAAPPPGWAEMTPEERMVAFARAKGARKDAVLVDQWQWWRAHRVAGIVSRVKRELGENTPLWAFTLTWDKGWHHGQDPVMMNDAGVDADALMLYEANAEQFTNLLRDWSRYVKRGDVQLVVGDVIDWPLHQRHPDGPKDFYRRTVRAIDGIYGDGPAAGVFFHDLARALWGRKGDWTTKEWLDEAKAAADYMRSKRSRT